MSRAPVGLLLALAALLTLLCSSRLLGSANLATRHKVEETGATSAWLPSLSEYMHSSNLLSDGDGAPHGADASSPPPTTAAPPLVRATSMDAASSPVPITAASPLARATPMATFTDADYDDHFITARDVRRADPAYLRRLLKSLLGMAVLLKRTLVLPPALCNCRDAALTDCDGPAAPSPFDCPLRLQLDADAWRSSQLVKVRPARFLLHGPASASAPVPDIARCSHLRVLLPDGMDDSELSYALRSYASTRWLEVDVAEKAFCGWDTRMPGNPQRMQDFTRRADALLAGGDASAAPATQLHECTHYRGGTGEVLQFSNLGCNARHEVTARREKLPANLRGLPNGTDIMVTFATGSVATMACNWVATVRRAGVQEVLIGALDQKMMDACAEANVPCILIEGGAITRDLARRTAENVREDPKSYPKLSILKVGSAPPNHRTSTLAHIGPIRSAPNRPQPGPTVVPSLVHPSPIQPYPVQPYLTQVGFYRELLTFGFNVWACDADAVFFNDPRAMMRQPPWSQADIAVATDCIDVEGDNRYPLTHCDYNTGLVYMRSRPAVIEFTEVSTVVRSLALPPLFPPSPPSPSPPLLPPIKPALGRAIESARCGATTAATCHCLAHARPRASHPPLASRPSHRRALAVPSPCPRLTHVVRR